MSENVRTKIDNHGRECPDGDWVKTRKDGRIRLALAVRANDPRSAHELSLGSQKCPDGRVTWWGSRVQKCPDAATNLITYIQGSSSRLLLPFPPLLSEPYQDHPPWQISNWERSPSSGELSSSSLYTLTDLFPPAVEKLESKGRPIRPRKTLL